MSLQIGEIIDSKYRIVRVLGQGGMGTVYEGENTRIHRRVAIKVLHASSAAKADIVQRFEREAQAAGRIGSEHIVEVLDLGSLPTGERYMVMEFLDGESLSDRIKARGRLRAEEAAPILRQLLTGLGAAHRAGIIHRDMKPDNVYLVAKHGRPELVKILDFGVSKFSGPDNEFSMTRTGAVMGTPYYMSPEQARGQPVDYRSDLYSVGVVGYQMLTGHVPFNADTFNELLFKIALESPEPAELVAPGLDPGFSQIIMRGMAREAGHRFQSAAEFAYALDQWSAHVYGQPQYLRQSNPGVNLVTGPHQTVNVITGQHPQLQIVTGPHPQVNVALAVTNREPKRSGAMVAVALVTLGLVGIGGGVAVLKYTGKSSASAGESDAKAATPTTATASATAAPSEASATASSRPEPTASVVPVLSATSNMAHVATPAPAIPQLRPAPPTIPPPQPTTPVQPGGRKISGSL